MKLRHCTKGYTDNLVSNIFTNLLYSTVDQSAALFAPLVTLKTNNLFVIKVNSSAGSRSTLTNIFTIDPTAGTMLTYLPIPLYVGVASLFTAPVIYGYLNVLYNKLTNSLQLYFVQLTGSTITSYSLYIYTAT